MRNWDDYAQELDDTFLKDPIYLDVLRSMVQQVGDIRMARILDLGCGTGNLITILLESFPDSDISAVDPSASMRDECAKRFGTNPNVTISCGDGANVPFPDAYFDCVMSNLALHHVLPDLRPKCAEEISRILKGDGCLIYSDIFCEVAGPLEDPIKCKDIIERLTTYALYVLEHGAYEKMLFLLEQIPKHISGDGEYLTTVGEWTKTLNSAGFDNIEVIDIRPLEVGFRIIRCQKARGLPHETSH